MVTANGARIRKADSFMERYQSDALLQAGSGMPNWSWHRYSLLLGTVRLLRDKRLN